MTEFLVAAIALLGAFTQSLAGFGTGLVTMPLLVEVIDLQLAAPFVALISVIINGSLTIYYKQAFELQALSRLVFASLLAVPLGVFALQNIEEQYILTLLSILITGYALYTLLEMRLPQLNSPKWAYMFGSLSGLLAGAYNIGGPPVVVYADCCRWNPAKFKSNLSGFFSINLIMVIASHAFQGNFKQDVWELFFYAFPAVISGLVAGIILSRYLNPLIFRKIVLILLVMAGVRLIL